MYIRHLIGPRKGEIEDVIFDRARMKVLSGEAEDIYHQLAVPPMPVNIAARTELEAGLPSPHVSLPRDATTVVHPEIASLFSKKKSRR